VKSEGLLCSHQPAAETYHERDESTPHIKNPAPLGTILISSISGKVPYFAGNLQLARAKDITIPYHLP